MSARANWFVEAVESLDDEPDPFKVPIEEVGDRIDLGDPKSRLALRVTELLHREAALDSAGITCAIKARADSTCHACPVSQANDSSKPLSRLCKVGREQEVVLTELAVLGCREIAP